MGDAFLPETVLTNSQALMVIMGYNDQQSSFGPDLVDTNGVSFVVGEL